MKKIKIEGELKKELGKQLDDIAAIRRSIEALSQASFNRESKMWDHLKKEFPSQSDNCTFGKDGDDLVFIDRLVDESQG